jgi:hypothetical protein
MSVSISSQPPYWACGRHYPQALGDLMERQKIQFLMVTHLRHSGLGVGEVGVECASDPNCKAGISANHLPNTERRAEATASRAANVTSPACWGWALLSVRAWWLPSVVTVQSVSSGWMAAPLMYQVASPTGTASLSMHVKRTCIPAFTDASCGGSRTSKRQPVGKRMGEHLQTVGVHPRRSARPLNPYKASFNPASSWRCLRMTIHLIVLDWEGLMLGSLEGQQPSPTGPTVTALMAARDSKGKVLSDFRELHREGVIETSFASPFPAPLSSPLSLNPCRPRRSSHLWKEPGGSLPSQLFPRQVEPLLEGILETSVFSLGSPPLKSGSSQR